MSQPPTSPKPKAKQPCQIMGILNVTPDSFSDGGKWQQVDKALQQAEYLVNTGASILDIGGESTRPGAIPVDATTELQRVIPVIEALHKRQFPVTLSIDTYKAAVASEALAAGARIVNDTSSLGDPNMGYIVAHNAATIILMHMQGTPATMQTQPVYNNVVSDIQQWLSKLKQKALQVGIAAKRIWLDPGLGFGKTTEQNLQLLKNLRQLCELDQPVVVGASRKQFLANLLGDHLKDPQQRDAATAFACGFAILQGASIVRVHDPQAVRDAVKLADCLA